MAEVTISTGGEQTGSGGSGSVTSIDVSGGTTGLTFSGGPITTAGTFTTSGTLSRANGGTGETTANAAFNALSPNTTRGDITVMNATVNARLALGSAGKILRSDGTDLVYSTATYPNTVTANNVLIATGTDAIGTNGNFKYDNSNNAILLNGASYGTENIAITAGSKYGVNVGLTAASGWAAYRAFVNSSSTTLTDNIGMILSNANTTAGSGIAFQMNVGGTTGAIGFASYLNSTASAFQLLIKSSNAVTSGFLLNGSTKAIALALGITSPTSFLHIGHSMTAASWSQTGLGLRVADVTLTDSSGAGSATWLVGNSFGAFSFAATNARTITHLVGSYFPAPSAGTNVTHTSLFCLGTGGNAFFDGFISVNKQSVNRTPSEAIDVIGNIVLSGQAYNPIFTITYGATITPDWNNSGTQKVVLNGNPTIANSSNIKSGAIYIMYIYQDGSAPRTISSWGSQYKFPSGVAPTLSSSNNQFDILTFSSDGTNLYLVGITNNPS